MQVGYITLHPTKIGYKRLKPKRSVTHAEALCRKAFLYLFIKFVTVVTLLFLYKPELYDAIQWFIQWFIQ